VICSILPFTLADRRRRRAIKAKPPRKARQGWRVLDGCGVHQIEIVPFNCSPKTALLIGPVDVVAEGRVSIVKDAGINPVMPPLAVASHPGVGYRTVEMVVLPAVVVGLEARDFEVELIPLWR